MTVSTVAAPISYTGNNTTAVFAYTWRILSEEDIVVWQTTAGVTSLLVLNTDYTVSGVLEYTGGNVTLLAGNLPTDDVLLFFRDPSPVQDTSLQNQGQYNAKVVETSLDLLTMEMQAADAAIARSLRIPLGEDALAVLPSAADRANMIQGYDNAGLPALLATSDTLGAGNFIVDTFVGGIDYTAGSTTSLTLSQAPGTVNNTLILFDGVAQQITTYALAGAVVTFDAAIPVGVLKVEARQAGVVSINSPANNSVGTGALQTGAVTSAKIATETIVASNIAADTILPANMSPGALQAGKNTIINGAALIANGTDYVASVSGTYGYGKSELCKGAIVATTVAGTLTQATASSLGRTGRTFKWSAVTTTGPTSVLTWRFFVESKDAAAYIGQTASASAQVRHDAGVPVDFSINLYKATGADNFAGLTLISAGQATAVASATNTSISKAGQAMGTCGNGILVEVQASVAAAVTSKNFEVTEVQLELGSSATSFEFKPIEVTVNQVLRFFEVLGSGGATGSVLAVGQATLTTAAIFGLFFFRKRVAPTVTSTFPTDATVSKADGTTQSVVTTLFTAITPIGAYIQITGMAAGLVAGDSCLLIGGSSGGALITLSARF